MTWKPTPPVEYLEQDYDKWETVRVQFEWYDKIMVRMHYPSGETVVAARLHDNPMITIKQDCRDHEPSESIDWAYCEVCAQGGQHYCEECQAKVTHMAYYVCPNCACKEGVFL